MKKTTGLSVQAYRKFKDALMTRNIALGATMTQSDLADTLSVSVSPLRDALKILESEGFVEVLPRSGIKIAEPDIDFIKNCYQLRRIIEEPALLKFSEQCSQEELDQIKQAHLDLLAGCDEKLVNTDPLFQRARELDADFHVRMVRSLDNPFIDSIYRTNQERSLLVRLRLNKAATSHYVSVTLKEHIMTIDALMEGDVEKARLAHLDHLDKAIQRSMGF